MRVSGLVLVVHCSVVVDRSLLLGYSSDEDAVIGKMVPLVVLLKVVASELISFLYWQSCQG